MYPHIFIAGIISKEHQRNPAFQWISKNGIFRQFPKSEDEALKTGRSPAQMLTAAEGIR
ncbi:MAG TPA: hypothetical protein PKN56_21705 [Leptospiraceae bacterium]|nr:hypothetical protein [Leptospiraceae bacterium]HNO23711.1 hypothetical protein [Leptospiraceae bacterium]